MTTTTEPPSDVLSISEVAKLLRIGRNLAYESAARGEIPSFRIGGRVLVSKLALFRHLGIG